MDVNALPRYDDTDNPTKCCPRFKPEGWDGQDLHFKDKPFIRARTRSIMHVPINMSSVFDRVLNRMQAVEAFDSDDYIVLSRELSPWKADHYFSATKPVEGEETVTLTGDFVTKVFEGPFQKMRGWHEEMRALARENGATTDEVYFFYTTCPKCAKTYGENYVVGVARTD